MRHREKTGAEHGQRDGMEEVLDALALKDLEIVQAFAEIARSLLTGRPRPSTLSRRLARGGLLGPGLLERVQLPETMPKLQQRKIRRLARRYAALRTLCVEVLAAAERTGRTPQQRFGELSSEVVGLLTQMEDVRSRVWSRYAATDELTGLLNRTVLEDVLDEELRRARRLHHPISVALVDADRFKRVNDEYGHAAGDAVLAALAETVAGGVRASDHVLRYGGEEFLLVLPRTSRVQARRTLERLCREVADTPIALPGGGSITVTVSVGHSVLRDPAPPAAALRAADAALFEAKRAGRNRVRYRQAGSSAHGPDTGSWPPARPGH